MILDRREGYEIDDDKGRLDVDALHAFLTTSYWSEGISKDIVQRSVDGSDCFGVFAADEQVGFGRVVTDGAIFAYLCDVYVLPNHRGQGLGKWLVGVIMAVPRYTTFRRWVLATRDAHDLYRSFGFGALEDPAKFMEIRRSNTEIYPSSATSTK